MYFSAVSLTVLFVKEKIDSKYQVERLLSCDVQSLSQVCQELLSLIVIPDQDYCVIDVDANHVEGFGSGVLYKYRWI